MRRLRELQMVTVTPSGPAQSFPCRVVMIEGAQAVLLSRDAAQTPFLRDCMLTFEHAGHPVALLGHCRRGRDEHELQFMVGDGVSLPRRESSRLSIALDVRVSRAEVQGAAEGAGTGDSWQWSARTVDISAKGVLIEPAGDLAVDDGVQLELELPGPHGAIPISGRVVRVDGGRAGIDLTRPGKRERELLERLIHDRKLTLALQL